MLGLDLVEEEAADLDGQLAVLAARFGIPIGTVDEMMDGLLARRAKARDDRDWAISDAIRVELADVGVIVEDTADGARWHRG